VPFQLGFSRLASSHKDVRDVCGSLATKKPPVTQPLGCRPVLR
jgi:hypothetical protein